MKRKEGNQLRTQGRFAQARTKSIVTSKGSTIGGRPLPGLLDVHIAATRVRTEAVHNRVRRSPRVHARSRVTFRWRIHDDVAFWTFPDTSIGAKAFGRLIRMRHDRLAT